MKDNPLEVLLRVFPSISKNFPISGGWGRARHEACCVDIEDGFSADGEARTSALEVMSVFVEKSIYIDLIVDRSPEEGYKGISWRLVNRRTVTEVGRVYELHRYEISAFLPKDWLMLKSEWEGVDGIGSSDFDIEDHLRKRMSLEKKGHRDFWFDITRCYKASLFGYSLPWIVAGFGRGKMVNYEIQSIGQGYSVAYHGLMHPKSTEATVYFYTSLNDDILDGCDGERIIEAFRSIVAEIDFYYQNIQKAKFNLLKFGRFATHIEDLAFLHAEIEVNANAEKTRSHVFLRGSSGRYIKIRITLPAQEDLKDLPFRFVDELSCSL